jgi:hypothetical protein
MKNILILTLLTTYLYSSAAIGGDSDFVQEDGSTFQGKLKGDEWFNWIEDKDENILIYNKKTKNYEYAMLKSSNGKLDLTTSGVKVGSKLRPSGTKIDKKDLSKIWKQKRYKAYNFKNYK